MASTSNHPKGPPYLPMTASVGGVPTVSTDIPINSVFIVMYLACAIANIIIFRKNSSKKHKFLISAFLTGFSMARVITNVMRIVWATRPTNARIVIATMIFTNAGILIIYIVNLLLAQRILRAKQPRLGWHPALRILFRTLYALFAVTFILVITMTILNFYTLDAKIHSIASWILRGAITYILVFTILPLVLLGLAFLLPRPANAEHFGHGSIEMKAVISLITTCLSIWVAGFKAGTSWEAPRPQTDPAWYDSKAAFYCFGFVLEIIILVVFMVGRIDKRFHVPNGSSKARTYLVENVGTRPSSEEGEEKEEIQSDRVDSAMTRA